jgi:hypothetical protein
MVTMVTKTTTVTVAQVLRREVLAGRAAGQADYPKIERTVRAAATADGRVMLDFTGVGVLSSSYFDAGLWPLWSVLPELYPTLSKVPQTAVDDIEIVLRANNAAAWCFRKDADRSPQLLGTIDSALKTTLGRVVEVGELTAGDLIDVDRSIGMTAWSNRLAALHELRLVRRRKDGRRLIYLASWKE